MNLPDIPRFSNIQEDIASQWKRQTSVTLMQASCSGTRTRMNDCGGSYNKRLATWNSTYHKPLLSKYIGNLWVVE